MATLWLGPLSPRVLWTSAGSDEAAIARILIEQVRLPRAILALTIGASLGIAGAALQGLLRNPLAEPGLLGVSGCAALGAVIAYYSGWSVLVPMALPIAGMLGATLAALAVVLLAGRDAGVLTLILAGVAVNSLAGALTALALNLSPNPFAAYEIVVWMLGSVADRSFEHVAIAMPFMLAGWLVLLLTGRALDVLSLGEDGARSLGVDVAQVRNRVTIGVALCVGAAVSVSGVIGFVGLVVPHLLRPLVGPRPARLLPASAVGGAALTLAADVLVRLGSGGAELKLGVVTALVGAPFFFWLVVRSRNALP
ncbi:MAG: iron ABC transporter permease [Gammaproteobacteria bacterium]|nr:iron ABC transporter permease [Gammaproteobacteria bacterium]